MARSKRAVALGAVLVSGCTLVVDLSGLSTPDAGVSPDAGRDADRDAGRDAAADAVAPAHDAAIDTGAGTTTVSCSDPSSCASKEGCCIVYGDHVDYCVAGASSCVFNGPGRVVYQDCDDETDCAALGSPNTICCATIEPSDNTFKTITCVAPDACSGGIHLCDATAKHCPDGKTCKKGRHSADSWTCE